jgi:uncharacterized DUF497 family protein
MKMRITEVFPATHSVENKIWTKHRIAFQEIREVFFNSEYKPIIARGRSDSKSKWRYAALGRTSAGRYLAVVFVMQSGGIARVITSREMTRSERRRYQR